MSRRVVVVGAGLGGLSAAIHSRLLGWDVTVLEQQAVSGGKAQQQTAGDHTFELGPSIVILPEIYGQLFERAGRNLKDYLKFERLDPITRVYMEGSQVLDLPADYPSCLESIRELCADDAESLETLIRGIDRSIGGLEQAVFEYPIDQPWDLLRPGFVKFGMSSKTMVPFKGRVDRIFSHPMLKAFFYGFPSYGGQSWKSISPGAFLIPYFMMRRGVWSVAGGVGAIPRAIQSLAEEIGVEFRFGCEVTGVRIEKGKVRDVQSLDQEIACDAVISSRCRTSFKNLIGRGRERKPSYSYMTLNMGFSEPTAGLKHHTLLIPENFERGFEEVYDKQLFPTRPIVYLNQTAPTNLFAAVTCPADEPQLQWETRADEYRNRIMYELEVHGINAHAEIEIAQTPLRFAGRDGNFKGSLYGPVETQRLWGIFPERCRDEQIPNLFYAGGSVQPGAGMPMVVLSGKFAAQYLGPA